MIQLSPLYARLSGNLPHTSSGTGLNMRFGSLIYLTSCLTATVLGKNGIIISITNVPQVISASIDNAQSRILARLVLLDPMSGDFEGQKSRFKMDYTASFDPPQKGEYQLTISSHDLILSQNRWRIVFNTDTSSFLAYEMPFDSDVYNSSSATLVSHNSPLLVSCLGIIDVPDIQLRSLKDMIMNTPLGVIFKSRLYTFMFLTCFAIILLPHIMAFVSPDLVEQIHELKK